MLAKIYSAAQEGLAMLILNSSDAIADARLFEAAGIGSSKVFDFGREGTRPDGTPVKLAFSLAFASDPTVAITRAPMVAAIWTISLPVPPAAA